MWNLLARCGRFVSSHLFRLTGFRLMAVGALILSFILPAMLRYQELEKAQNAFIHEVQLLGGSILLAPTGTRDAPPPLLTADLGRIPIDGDLIKRLSTFTTIERLNLDGAELANEDYRALGLLTALRSLSLAGSNISDTDVSWSGIPLTTLSLRNTSVTDIGLSRLEGITSLVNLEINDTAVTAAGLPSLRRLSSLKMLDLDDTCMTNDGVLALQAMKSLESIRIHVTNGFGRETKELVSRLAGSVSVQGINPSGHLLWNAAEPWDETLAGVVEIVTHEVDLDPQQVTQLIEAIGPRGVGRQKQMRNPQQSPAQPPRSGEEIQSVAEFLRRLQGSAPRTFEVCAFARDSFTKDDIPQLLDALNSITSPRDSDYLVTYGSYLLVRIGMETPEATRELDRMFAHEDSGIRARTVYGFSRYGHPFMDDWVPNENAVEFGLPRLLRLSKDPEQTVRLAVSEVLGDICHHHPKRAPEVMPVLIEMIEQGDFAYVNSSIRKIVEVNPQVGRTHIPKFRQLLKNSAREKNHAHFIAEVLCELARGDPSQAQDVAVDCLELIRDGVLAGRQLVTLVTAENSEAVRTIVRGLLEISAGEDLRLAEFRRATLVSVAMVIRDLQAGKDSSRSKR